MTDLDRVILLDSGPLGMVTHPQRNLDIKAWLQDQRRRRVRVVVPEIADYEVRRELLLANRRRGIERLDRLRADIGFVPITTEMMLRAAVLWADARRRGRPTSDPHALDGDVILAAQALVLQSQGYNPIVATTNVSHLAQFVDARRWQDIP